MKAEIKKKWIEVLRSGKYKQTKGRLQRIKEDNGNCIGHCCLGVLLEVLIENGVPITKASVSETHAIVYSYAGEDSYTSLRHCLVNEVELSTQALFDLLRMNDGGKSFVEIADHIEKNL